VTHHRRKVSDMSNGANPQMTLRDYFARYPGIEHVLIANILDDQLEFYVKAKGMKEVDGMHFRVDMNGKITEVGLWEE
jgi:hypothetical protein